MMLVLTILISRLVPLLFLASLVLVASRYLHDRFGTNRLIAKTVMISILALGTIVAAPMVMRAFAVTMAEVYYLRHDWTKADEYFDLYTRLNGKSGDLLLTDWVQALMNKREWKKAEAVLLSSVERKGDRVSARPEDVLRLGICRYYDGRLNLAERTFLALPGGMIDQYLKHYFLGRISEKKGNGTGALEHYTRVLQESPDFFPAVYQSVRLHLMLSNPGPARNVLNRFTSGKSISSNRWVDICRTGVQTGQVPQEMEFLIVQISN